MGCIATVEVDNGRAVSDGGNDAPPLEEAVANMHLIAAAPDMYEALEAAANSAGFQYMWPNTRSKIEAALAKARGET
ncbi:hypothetical protein D7027_13045 [Ochrobactrum intermedium]|nr:hypothetical protein [Brucella intermedia]